MKSFLQTISILLIFWILNQPAEATVNPPIVQWYYDYLEYLDNKNESTPKALVNNK